MKRSKSGNCRRYILLGLFSVAMAALEAIVVIYLRQLYYPQGFGFPLAPASLQMVFTEWLREAATIVMLLVIGALAGKGFLQGFFCFLYTFAVWDIFYYVWLKILINWPPSLLTGDLLFLIPVPWASPVLAPVIFSLALIVISVSLVALQGKGYSVRVKAYEWCLVLLGAFLVWFTFIKDYAGLIIRENGLANIGSLAKNERFWKAVAQFEPPSYDWYMFALGEIIIISVFASIVRRAKRGRSTQSPH
ncbi:MAG: hypothetical protein LLF89_00470 [Spirochaetaceae bacterium]|nr:hypothetical protein [Spirochaetaceae bacterium]